MNAEREGVLIHEYAEPVGNPKDGRSIMRRDVVIDGVLIRELSGIVGSPAPTAVVRAAARQVRIRPTKGS